jgi:hypothetical protein
VDEAVRRSTNAWSQGTTLEPIELPEGTFTRPSRRPTPWRRRGLAANRANLDFKRQYTRCGRQPPTPPSGRIGPLARRTECIASAQQFRHRRAGQRGALSGGGPALDRGAAPSTASQAGNAATVANTPSRTTAKGSANRRRRNSGASPGAALQASTITQSSHNAAPAPRPQLGPRNPRSEAVGTNTGCHRRSRPHNHATTCRIMKISKSMAPLCSARRLALATWSKSRHNSRKRLPSSRTSLAGPSRSKHLSNRLLS